MLSGVSNAVLEFGGFRLNGPERRLTRDGAPVELNARYFDALLMLAGCPGKMITKDRFMAEVWSGIPVTDEALTQCIRVLRKVLGDEAARPRFIETVPRHGYRFIAEVVEARDASVPEPTPEPLSQLNDPKTRSAPGSAECSHLLLVGAAGLVGGAAAGLVGGLGYGLLAAADPPLQGGAVSVVLVLTCLCLLVGLLGGFGVSVGAALGQMFGRERLFPVMLGGALGGLVVGAAGRLIGLDAFSLLIGSRPAAITGGSEGLLIGAFAGLALWLVAREAGAPLRVTLAKGALLGAAGGLLVVLGGGRMMAGSLAGLVAAHPQAPLAHLLGSLDPAVLLLAGAAEGAIFLAALALAFTLALRSKG